MKAREGGLFVLAIEVSQIQGCLLGETTSTMMEAILPTSCSHNRKVCRMRSSSTNKQVLV